MARTHDDWAALAVGHALHALDPADEQRFLEHLGECGTCPGVLADARATVADLAYAAPAADPPAALRTALLAEAAPAPVVPLQRRPRRWLTPALVSAAAAGLAVLTFLNLSLRAELDDQEQLLAAQQRAVALLAAPDAVRVALDEPGDGQMQAVAVVHDDRVSLVVEDLPTNSSDSVYVLWLVPPGGEAEAVATFDVHQAHDVVRAGQLDRALREGDVLAVSHEPGRVAPSAATRVVAAGTVSPSVPA